MTGPGRGGLRRRSEVPGPAGGRAQQVGGVLQVSGDHCGGEMDGRGMGDDGRFREDL